jgi:E3 ubiquitin-protein ligase UBR7
MEDNNNNNMNNEPVITMLEILQQQKILEEEAEAQLEQYWGEEDKCTFNEGYITQPIFSCNTCISKNKGNKFGFCFGCSMKCHIDHEIFELFEKRNFRCDCGTKNSICECLLDCNNGEKKKYS